MATISESFLKSYKFQFDVVVEKIELQVSFSCQVSVIWKRGNNKIETKAKPSLDVSTNQAAFNEKLTMFSNMYFNEKIKSFHEKKTSFTVVLGTSKGNKVAGSYNLDLGALINNKVVELSENYKLEKCPDKNAKIFLKIKTSFLGEVKDVDAVSQFTGVNESFEVDALTSQSLENVKDTSEKNENKEIIINKNAISLENGSGSGMKEKENPSEKTRFLEEKSRTFQNDNNELIKELNKKKAKEKEDEKRIEVMMKRMETIESEKNNLLKNVTLLNEKIQILSQNQSKETSEKSRSNEMFSEYKENFEKEKQSFMLERENLQNSLNGFKQTLNKYEFQLNESKKKNSELAEANSKYELNFQKAIEKIKQIESENVILKEKIRNYENDMTSNNNKDSQSTKIYEQKNKELETKLAETLNLNAGLEKKIQIYSKEMENRFKKLIQDSEKKEIENKDLLKKTEMMTVKLQEHEKTLLSSNSKNSKYEILVKENNDLKNEKQNLKDALDQMEEKMMNLENRLQELNENESKNGDFEALLSEYEGLQAKHAALEMAKNKMENDFSQMKINWAKSNNEVGLLREEVLQNKKKIAKMKEMEEQFELNQEELRKNKQRIGDAINIAFEVGGSDLVDRLINAMKF